MLGIRSLLYGPIKNFYDKIVVFEVDLRSHWYFFRNQIITFLLLQMIFLTHLNAWLQQFRQILLLPSCSYALTY